MRHLIDITDLTRSELDSLLDLGQRIARVPRDYSHLARERILATLFFEPSTRTRLSFESAMLSLGGHVLGFSEATSSSSTKGETVGDTVRTVSCYSDVIAMRHPLEGAAMMAALHAQVPVVNAGDGGHAHPTQTLTDLLTLRREKGGIDGLTLGLIGDLKYGRTVHSLINALSYYTGVKLVFISPPELGIPDYMKTGVLQGGSLTWRETSSLEQALPELDVIYMTRIQRERFDDLAAYERLKGSYVLDARKMQLARPDAVVLHPLPRVDEIAPEVDSDPRAAYFRQVQNGKFIRMALLQALTSDGLSDRPLFDEPHARRDLVCHSPRCITSATHSAQHIFVPSATGWKCLYCEHEAAVAQSKI